MMAHNNDDESKNEGDDILGEEKGVSESHAGAGTER